MDRPVLVAPLGKRRGGGGGGEGWRAVGWEMSRVLMGEGCMWRTARWHALGRAWGNRWHHTFGLGGPGGAGSLGRDTAWDGGGRLAVCIGAGDVTRLGAGLGAGKGAEKPGPSIYFALGGHATV
jgi:hypothetical protein